MTSCKVCKSPSTYYLTTQLLSRYQVSYYKCQTCEFIQTEDPYWLDEAYASAITKLDIGLVSRNEFCIPVVQAIINTWQNPNGRFIDYGGGYGMLVRMMRDRGYDYYRQDTYCPNLYAESFDVSDVAPFKADLLTAFEVFEHLPDPVSELEKMLGYSDTILFSTIVQPTDAVTPDNWWYFIPETGQHVALYSRTSLYTLAARFGLHYCWNEQNIHLFSRKKVDSRLYKLITHPRLSRWYVGITTKRKSLLTSDFQQIRSQLNK